MRPICTTVTARCGRRLQDSGYVIGRPAELRRFIATDGKALGLKSLQRQPKAGAELLSVGCDTCLITMDGIEL